MDEILKQYYEALGNDPKNYKRFNSFLDTLAEAESFSGKRQSSTKSSAKGFYHYLTNSVKTSDKRINNLSKRHYVDPKLKAVIDAQMKLPVDKRSRDMQSIMVLSDLMESPKAPYSAWQKGEVSNQELYYRGHHGTSSKAISSQEQVYENWDNAATRLKKNKQYELGGMTDPGKKKKKKLVEAIDKSTGLIFDPETADRLFGVNGKTPDPINFGKYSKFFKEQGNTSGGDRSIVQLGKHYNDKAYKDIINPYLKKQNPGVNFKYNFGGDMMSQLTGSGASSVMGMAGGPLGIANMAAGILSPIVQKAFGDPMSQANDPNAGSEDFDFGAKYTQGDAKSTAKVDSVFDTVGGAVKKVPLVGEIANLAISGVGKGISKLFSGKGSSDEDIMGEYMSKFRPENQAAKKTLYGAAFGSQQTGEAELGGEFAGGPMMNPELTEAGVYNVGGNDTHGTNPMGGYTFDMSENGKSTAEKGEVIIPGRKNNKLVFTNKF